MEYVRLVREYRAKIITGPPSVTPQVSETNAALIIQMADSAAKTLSPAQECFYLKGYVTPL